MKIFLFLFVVTTTLLTACGGGGGSASTSSSAGTSSSLSSATASSEQSSPSSSDAASSSSSPEVLTGVFVDAVVEGLHYSTATQSGVTDAQGRFQYQAGETVTFTLLNQELGDTPGSSVVTPMSLQGESSDAAFALNVVRFLLTINEHPNALTGIKVPALGTTLAINFNQSLEAFGSDPAVVDFLSTNFEDERVLVSAEDAAAHFSETLKTLETDYSINLQGRQAFSVFRGSNCPGPEAVAGWRYTFTSSGLELSGSDTFIDCLPGGEETISLDYDNDIVDLPFNCGSAVCTYADLNKVIQGVDEDDREFISTYSHTPGTNLFTYIKRITSGDDAGSVSSEYIVLDGYQIDLRGMTAVSTITYSNCPGATAGWTYTFTETGFTMNGSDSFSECMVGADETLNISYTDIPEDIPFNCEGNYLCDFEDLNKIIEGTDEDSRPYRSTYWHIPGSRTLTYVKRITGGLDEGVTFTEVITLQ